MIQNHGRPLDRLVPIMLLKLLIMLWRNAPEFCLLCSIYEVARDPTSRMPFIGAGLEIRTIGCSYVY